MQIKGKERLDMDKKPRLGSDPLEIVRVVNRSKEETIDTLRVGAGF